ncbi:MAG: hypothetical protein U0V04_08605 [Spirosomataceae bacterium]|jgi:hypothetical protein
MKKIIFLPVLIVVTLKVNAQISSTQNLLGGLYTTPASASNAFAVKGVIVPTSPGASSSALYGLINSVSDNSGYGIKAEHQGLGIGAYAFVPSGGINGRAVYSSSTSSFGLYAYSSDGDGLEITAINGANGATIIGSANSFYVSGDAVLTGIGEAEGKVLMSDVNGNATWQHLITRTGFVSASSQADTTIDGTLLKRRLIYTGAINADVVTNGDVTVYAKAPSGEVFILPYQFNAQGLKATLGYTFNNGKIIITCYTHDNSGAVSVDSNYLFQAVITPKKLICSGAPVVFGVSADKGCQSTVPCK